MKSFELRISEGVQLVKDLERALTLERGGGTPLTRREYLYLREIALQWVRQNEFVGVRRD
jgi:hypothetical protein